MFIIKLKTFNALFVKIRISHLILNFNDILIMFIINHFNNVNYVKNNSNVIWKIILLNAHKILDYHTAKALLHYLISRYKKVLLIKVILFKIKMNLYNDEVIKYKNIYFK